MRRRRLIRLICPQMSNRTLRRSDSAVSGIACSQEEGRRPKLSAHTRQHARACKHVLTNAAGATIPHGWPVSISRRLSFSCRLQKRTATKKGRPSSGHPSVTRSAGFCRPLAWWCGDLSSSVDSLRAREAMQDLWRLQVIPQSRFWRAEGRDWRETAAKSPADRHATARQRPNSNPFPPPSHPQQRTGGGRAPSVSGAIVGAKVTVASDESVSCLLSFSLPEATTGQPFVQSVPQSRQPLAPSRPGRRLEAAAWREAAGLV
jgi:hypothetical protein